MEGTVFVFLEFPEGEGLEFCKIFEKEGQKLTVTTI
jgi:hypothetical protein